MSEENSQIVIGVDRDGNPVEVNLFSNGLRRYWQDQATSGRGKSCLTGDVLRKVRDCLAAGGSVAIVDPKAEDAPR